MGASVLGALLFGLIIGAIPAITGGVKGKLGLGMGGFAACVVGSLLLGMILSIPLCALFMFLIFKKNDKDKKDADTTNKSTPDSAPDMERNSVFEQIQKLSELKDSGVLTEEEFRQKKEQLLSKI